MKNSPLTGEDGDSLDHEMAIELDLVAQLSRKKAKASLVFGGWVYLTHQVVASPFKPIDYMDKMDVFGYRYVKGHRPIISKYLVIELKKVKAKSDDLIQLMKYVDWIRNEYCGGDYSMIEAYLVAKEFGAEVTSRCDSMSLRSYVVGMKPPVQKEWSSLKLVKYVYDTEQSETVFKIIN